MADLHKPSMSRSAPLGFVGCVAGGWSVAACEGSSYGDDMRDRPHAHVSNLGAVFSRSKVGLQPSDGSGQTSGSVDMPGVRP
eukprot:365825-Chlamydomonas_euryale.AAC.2